MNASSISHRRARIAAVLLGEMRNTSQLGYANGRNLLYSSCPAVSQRPRFTILLSTFTVAA